MFSIRMFDHIAATSILVMDVDDRYLDDKWYVGDRFFVANILSRLKKRLLPTTTNIWKCHQHRVVIVTTLDIDS